SRGDYIAAAACMTRNGVLGEVPGWLYDLPGCDWAFDLLHADKGKIKYLPRVMAVYRRTSRGIWSGVPVLDRHLIAIEIAERLDAHFGHRYRADFNYTIGANYHALYQLIRERLYEYRHDFPASLPIFAPPPETPPLGRRVPGFGCTPYHNVDYRRRVLEVVDRSYDLLLVNPGPLEVAYSACSKLALCDFSVDSRLVRCDRYRRSLDSLIHISADYPQKDW